MASYPDLHVFTYMHTFHQHRHITMDVPVWPPIQVDYKRQCHTKEVQRKLHYVNCSNTAS